MALSETDVRNRIGVLVDVGLPQLPPSQRVWAEEHLASPPRRETFAAHDDGSGEVSLWLVTDHTGVRDASCRVVFDPEREHFGLVMDLQGGVKWFLGLYAGTFADAVMAI
jgi:hypothetical protein